MVDKVLSVLGLVVLVTDVSDEHPVHLPPSVTFGAGVGHTSLDLLLIQEVQQPFQQCALLKHQQGVV